jgi:chromosomal replication initiation ATPase DnaA
MESKYNDEGIHNCEQVFAYDMLQKDSANTENEHSDYNLEMFKKKLVQHTMTEEEYQINKMMLSASQQKVLQYIETHDNETKLHLFITGGAGTGKSFLLHMIREHLLRIVFNLLCLFEAYRMQIPVHNYVYPLHYIYFPCLDTMV